MVEASGTSPQDLPSDPRAAVTALFHAHYRSLVGLAVLLVDDRETAEDVVQEAFVGLYRHWSRLRDPYAAIGYLRSSTLNLSRSRLRRRRSERAVWLVPAPDLPPADSSVLARESSDEMAAAIGSLPRRQREVVVLRYFLDLSEQEIASMLSVSPGSVKQHASRALAALARRLEAQA